MRLAARRSCVRPLLAAALALLSAPTHAIPEPEPDSGARVVVQVRPGPAAGDAPLWIGALVGTKASIIALAPPSAADHPLRGAFVVDLPLGVHTVSFVIADSWGHHVIDFLTITIVEPGTLPPGAARRGGE